MPKCGICGGDAPNSRASRKKESVIFADVRLFLKRKKRKKKRIDAICFTIMSILKREIPRHSDAHAFF